ncbi:6176_t:CDS:1, partial [Paraglomus occultum]
ARYQEEKQQTEPEIPVSSNTESKDADVAVKTTSGNPTNKPKDPSTLKIVEALITTSENIDI